MNSIQRINILLLLAIFAIGSGILASCLGLWLLNYEEFTTLVLETVHKEHWRPYFETTVFPPQHFHISRYLAIIFCFGWGLFAFWFSSKVRTASQFIYYFLQQSKSLLSHQYQLFKPIEWRFFVGIMLLFIGRGLLQLYRYELQYDEAWTYNHFISNGFIVSAISPNNNHILYSLLACFFDYLPIEAKYSLRLPVYIGGWATCGLFYCFVRRFWNWQWALIALAWFAFSPSICFYSMYARGYIFQIFFTILALWSTLKICSKAPSKYVWTIWILSQILGFYSVPTYAYVWLLLNSILFFFILTQQTDYWRSWLIANTVVGFSLFLLFLPFIATHGLQTLLNIASNQAPQGEQFIHYQDKVADWLLLGAGRLTPVYWFWCLLILMLGYTRLQQTSHIQQKILEISCLFLLFPSLLNLSIGTQPPYRVWCFLAVFLGLVFPILGTQYLIVRPSTRFLTLLILPLISFNIWRTEVHYAICWSAQLDKTNKKLAQIMLDKELPECYFFSNYDKPLLECYYLHAQKRLQTFMIDSSSKNHAPFVHARLYAAVLWDKEDRISSPEEQAWLNQHYPIILYQDQRIELRQPSSSE